MQLFMPPIYLQPKYLPCALSEQPNKHTDPSACRSPEHTDRRFLHLSGQNPAGGPVSSDPHF